MVSRSKRSGAHSPVRRRLLLAAAASSVTLASAAHAQPAGPVTLVVPSSPGSGPDVIARLLGQRLSTSLNTNVVVENRAGANGIVGASFVARAAPDGRTLMLYDRLTLSVNPLLISKLPYNPDDLTGISDVASVDLLFVVRSDAPYKTWGEMLDFARAHPGKLSVGTAGVGSVHHLSLALIERHYRLDMTDVPYKGIAPAVTALLGGEITGVITGQETVLEHIRSGRLKALAMGSSRRSPLLPDVPTLQEAGAPGDLLVSTSFSLFGPSRMSSDTINGIYSAVSTALKDETLVSNLAARGLIVRPSSPAVVQEEVLRDRARFAPLIREENIRIS